MQFEKARQFIINKLNSELPKFLSYHNVQHTNEVIKYAERLAEEENITGDELVLLRTAALLHDTGYLEAYKGHEEISCSIAKTFLPQFEYSNFQIKRICELIMFTEVLQQPEDKSAQVLCDADLYYIGTSDYSAHA